MAFSITPESNTRLPARKILDNRGRARAAVVLLIAASALAAVAVLLGTFQLLLLSAISGGVKVPEPLLSLHDAVFSLVGLLQVLIYIGAAVPFLMWFRRAYENLSRLGASRLEHTPGWAVGAWFVPIVSLFHPLQMGREIWVESARLDSEYPDESEALFASGATATRDPTVGLWWACFLGMNFVNLVGSWVFATVKTLPGLMTGTGFYLASDVAAVGGAVAAIRIIRKVQAWQLSAESRREKAPQAFPGSE